MDFIKVVNQNYHMQGFCSDGEFMYWSFTDSLVKTTLSGTLKCQVQIHNGHLGDIDYYDGKLYASHLGWAKEGHDWDDWTSFKEYVFDASDLHIIDIMDMPVCYDYKKIAGTQGDTRGFRGIDGTAIAKDPQTGERKLFIACAIMVDERFKNQLILQCSLDGSYEKEYLIKTGNTVFGIQNLDYDETTGEFWFSTYNSEKPYQPKETLYKISPDLKEIRAKYAFSSPYGFECVGNGRYYASLQSGKNGARTGTAYICDENFFANNKTEREINEFIESKLSEV